jgi:hypothetical protein
VVTGSCASSAVLDLCEKRFKIPRVIVHRRFFSLLFAWSEMDRRGLYQGGQGVGFITEPLRTDPPSYQRRVGTGVSMRDTSRIFRGHEARDVRSAGPQTGGCLGEGSKIVGASEDQQKAGSGEGVGGLHREISEPQIGRTRHRVAPPSTLHIPSKEGRAIGPERGAGQASDIFHLEVQSWRPFLLPFEPVPAGWDST